MTNVVAHLALVATLNGIWASTLYIFLFHQASCHGVTAAVRWTEVRLLISLLLSSCPDNDTIC